MDAGKWISRERGAAEVEVVVTVEAAKRSPETFPLADRLSTAEVVSLAVLRARLRAQ